jgi:hypothetical protein
MLLDSYCVIGRFDVDTSWAQVSLEKWMLMSIVTRTASLIMLTASLVLASTPVLADRYSDIVCDGDCPRSGTTFDGIVALAIVAVVFFAGRPTTKVAVVISLGIPFAMFKITGNPLWIMAFVPSLFLSMYIAEPIAKYFGWEDDEQK